MSFWAAWWASSPSDRLLRVLHSIISVFWRPPNHFTHTQSLDVGSPSGPFTIFPGQASQPRVAPQIKSPIVKLAFVWLELVVGVGELRDADMESSDSITSVATGFIVFTGGDSFNRSKSLFSGLSSPLRVSSRAVSDPWSDDADSANWFFGSLVNFNLTARENDLIFMRDCECDVHERKIKWKEKR